MIGQFNAKNQEKKDSDQETEKPINGSESKGTVLLETESSIIQAFAQHIFSASELSFQLYLIFNPTVWIYMFCNTWLIIVVCYKILYLLIHNWLPLFI